MKNLIALLPLLFISSAHALVEVDVVANGSLMQLSTIDAKLGVGAGGLVTFDLIGLPTLQTGLIYETRKVGSPGFLGSSESSFKYLKIPLMARYSILPMISIGAGLYYAKASGDITSSVEIAGSKISSTSTYKNNAQREYDMGLMAGVGARIPLGLFHATAHANYLFGLADQFSAAGVDGKWKGFEIQVGLGMGI